MTLYQKYLKLESHLLAIQKKHYKKIQPEETSIQEQLAEIWYNLSDEERVEIRKKNNERLSNG
jgi:DNA-binding MarR family transcriptional regulator